MPWKDFWLAVKSSLQRATAAAVAATIAAAAAAAAAAELRTDVVRAAQATLGLR